MTRFTASVRERCACGAEYEEQAGSDYTQPSVGNHLKEWRERHMIACSELAMPPPSRVAQRRAERVH